MNRILKLIISPVVCVSVITSCNKLYFPDNSELCYVDLGLSVKWANMNVGAVSEEGYGKYYAWGEIDEKEVYSWETYMYCKGNAVMTKYCETDSKVELEKEDDVARIELGNSYRIPSIEEWRELKEQCSWTWAQTKNGVNGYKVTGKNGNYIFLPIAGYRIKDKLYDVGDFSRYWSSTRTKISSYADMFVLFGELGVDERSDERCNGYTVRSVHK